jgi:hypothetical protein
MEPTVRALEALVAADFFSVEVWMARVDDALRLVCHRSRYPTNSHSRYHCPSERRPDDAGGRDLLDVIDELLEGKKYLFLDRDTKYCAAFR